MARENKVDPTFEAHYREQQSVIWQFDALLQRTGIVRDLNTADGVSAFLSGVLELNEAMGHTPFNAKANLLKSAMTRYFEPTKMKRLQETYGGRPLVSLALFTGFPLVADDISYFMRSGRHQAGLFVSSDFQYEAVLAAVSWETMGPILQDYTGALARHYPEMNRELARQGISV